MTTMLTIKILVTINSVEKKKRKKLFIQNTIYSVNLTKENLFELKTFHFN